MKCDLPHDVLVEEKPGELEPVQISGKSMDMRDGDINICRASVVILLSIAVDVSRTLLLRLLDNNAIVHTMITGTI